MKNILILTSFILMFACSRHTDTKNPPLPRQIIDNNRSCESGEADKYNNIDELVKDFYKTFKYKDSLELNLVLGTYYYYKQKYDSALYYELAAKRIDSSDAKIHFDISLSYTELHDYNSALNSINTALSICGDKWEYLNSKCYILSLLHRCDESIEIGLISLKMNPDNKKIYGNLVRCFDELNQVDSVKKYIDIIEKRYYPSGIERSKLLEYLRNKSDKKISH